ncbi:hypothetical protein C8A00DRAFT_13373 [Chaetomidium leptoderma]|uniref:DUF8035 domain-containing protein n=1 Tax=Chaetomidium leptoderma TaxID=669021 RepID=A0AAN6ZZ69_9PEZI|nr:hypothetical protein C8A00DRAFT_13373 [Chaetomidium leptoderma]
MAYRTADPDLARPDRDAERWDRGRYEHERDRDRYSDVRERFEEDDDHVYARRGPPSRPPPLRDDRSPPLHDDDDDVVIRERSRERRRVVYEDEPPSEFRRRPSPPPDFRRRPSPPPDFRRRPSPPPEFRRRPHSPPPGEVERSRVVIEKERYRSPSPAPPPRRPAQLLRRQSSLDTFDRKPARRYWEREEYGPPARRDDYRPPPYVDIPLPRAKALPPPRVYAEREHFDEIQVSDPHRYGDDDFHAYPEKVREKEIIRTHRRTRSRSRESRATSRRRARSRSLSSSSSSSSGGTSLAARSEYPKKGKTRIPARLVSKRALIDLEYPFVEEGNTIIVQKALGQQNIDDLLKLSDDYKKSELEIMAARSSVGDIIEERIERRTEIYEGAAALPPPLPAPVVSGTGPVIMHASPPAPPPVEIVKTTVIRDVSPTRYTTTSYDTGTSYDTYEPRDPYTRSREVSGHVPVGPIALAGHHDHHHHHHQRDPYEADDLRSEIRHLEKQLARRDRSRHSHSHRRHRSLSRTDMVRAERLSTGELVLYEEEVEQIQAPMRAGPRLERDKRGRMSISVPKYR